MVPPKLAQHLSYKSAIALIPPSSLQPPIETVRRVYDKHFSRWPPHINLIYPFLASPSEAEGGVQQEDEQQQSPDPQLPHLKQDIRTRICSALQDIEPFEIRLSADPPGTFSHGARSKTVWLDPVPPNSDSSLHPLHRLQAALQAEFRECDADDRPFSPHLSIGQAKSSQEAQNLGEEIRKSVSSTLAEQSTNDLQERQPTVLDWYVDRVYVLERKGYYGRFAVVEEVNLGKK
ncbi:uncharacterized protein BDR25DRAFT_306242 [Lindgomyces ingoldianus]|uniref:Uncharacterized protein n=1 Tax=Lindgomyces ingoldianus TaxID=673940 RepID=A0ACB6QHJ9_9PLEO|nr:uncharacterized protein BDR25DRAFT_306242 [Lindgomyces ingoldianus]KAF2466458.1 hypothetical protein BDR25DRAFT_306242 [Lindgomyces ingoldianus]